MTYNAFFFWECIRAEQFIIYFHFFFSGLKSLHESLRAAHSKKKIIPKSAAIIIPRQGETSLCIGNSKHLILCEKIWEWWMITSLSSCAVQLQTKKCWCSFFKRIKIFSVEQMSHSLSTSECFSFCVLVHYTKDKKKFPANFWVSFVEILLEQAILHLLSWGFKPKKAFCPEIILWCTLYWEMCLIKKCNLLSSVRLFRVLHCDVCNMPQLNV